MSEKTDKKNKQFKKQAAKVLSIVSIGLIAVQIIAGVSFWLGTVYTNEQINTQNQIKTQAVEAYKAELSKANK